MPHWHGTPHVLGSSGQSLGHEHESSFASHDPLPHSQEPPQSGPQVSSFSPHSGWQKPLPQRHGCPQSNGHVDVVMSRGRIVEEIPREELGERRIVEAIVGSRRLQGRTA